MATGTKRRSRATKPDVEDVSSEPSAYMLGLSEQVASMADAVLIVQGTELPVHTYILAANSPVFADILEAPPAAPQKTKPLYRIPLEGDSLPVVCTALRYMYIGSLVVSPSKPAIQSCEDAAALVTFTHKYSMAQLLAKAEDHLIGEVCKDNGKVLFGDPKQLVAWVVLAETCKLDVFLAHAESFMIKHMDASFWQGEMAAVTGGISQLCFLRVLRGALHGRQEAVKALQERVHSASDDVAGYCSYCDDYCDGPCPPHNNRLRQSEVIEALDVSITTLTEWHKQDC